MSRDETNHESEREAVLTNSVQPWQPILLALVSMWVLFYPLLERGAEETEIQGDSVKYFAWLQTVFEDGDLQFADDFAELNPGISEFHLRILPSGHTPNYFTIGAPVLWSPFYLAGKAFVGLVGVPDRAAELDILIAAVRFGTRCYAVLALFLMFFITRRFFDSRIALLGSLAAYFGTAFYLYGQFNTVNSHAAGAFCCALFVYYCLRTGPDRGVRRWAIVGLLAGLVILCRLQDCVLLLWLAVEQAPRLTAALRRPSSLPRLLLRYLVALVVLLLVLASQIVAWTVIFGPFKSPLDYNANQAFWTRPELLNTLFSSRHGLFSWHPLTYLAIIGLVCMLFRHRKEAMAALAVFLALFFVNAAMADWWGGHSFGMRRFVSLSFVFAIGITAFAEAFAALLKKRAEAAVLVGVLLLAWWNVDLAGLYLDDTIPHDNPPPMEAVAARQLDSWFFGYPFAFPGNLIQSRLLGVESYSEADWLASRYLFYRHGNLGGEIEPGFPSFRDGFSRPRGSGGGTAAYRLLGGPKGVVLLNRRHLLPEEPVRTLAIDAEVISQLDGDEVPVIEVVINGRQLKVLSGTRGLVYLWGPVFFRTSDWRLGMNKLELNLLVGRRDRLERYRSRGFDPSADDSLVANAGQYRLRIYLLKFYDRKISNLEGYETRSRRRQRN